MLLYHFMPLIHISHLCSPLSHFFKLTHQEWYKNWFQEDHMTWKYATPPHRRWCSSTFRYVPLLVSSPWTRYYHTGYSWPLLFICMKTEWLSKLPVQYNGLFQSSNHISIIKIISRFDHFAPSSQHLEKFLMCVPVLFCGKNKFDTDERFTT